MRVDKKLLPRLGLHRYVSEAVKTSFDMRGQPKYTVRNNLLSMFLITKQQKSYLQGKLCEEPVARLKSNKP